MSINGLLTEVRWEWDGTELTADASASDTVLSVLSATAVSIDEQVWINFTGPYTITGLDEEADTITITPGLEGDCEEGLEVVPDVGGQPAQVWVAEVALPDAEKPIEVPLTIKDLAVMPEGEYDPPVAIIIAEDYMSVVDLPGSLPVIPGGYIPEDTLPTPDPPDPPVISPIPDPIVGPAAVVVNYAPEPGTVCDLYVWVPPPLGEGETVFDTPPAIVDETYLHTLEFPPGGFVYTDVFGNTLPVDTPVWVALICYLPDVPPPAPPSIWVESAAGQIPPEYLDLLAGDIIAQRLQTETLTSVTITASDLNIGPARWTPEEGIVMPQPDGQITRISADPDVPSSFAGKVVASFLTITQGLLSGLLESIGIFKLMSGVSAPGTAPDVVATWDYIQATTTRNLRGLCDTDDGTKWVSLDIDAKEVVGYDKTTGAESVLFSFTGLENFRSITRIGSIFYILYYPSGGGTALPYRVARYNMTGGFSSAFFSEFWVNDPANGDAVLGSNGTELLIAVPWGGNDVRVHRHNALNGLFIASQTFDNGSNGALGGISQGTHDFAASRTVIARYSNASPRVFATSGGARQTGDEFLRANSAGMNGLWWDGTRFWSLGTDKKIYKYETNKPDDTRTIAYAWLSESSGLRTMRSPITTFARPARAKTFISMGPPPEASASGANKANRITVYAGTTSGDLTLQADLAIGVLNYTVASTFATGGAAPVGSNGFAGVSSPGSLETESGLTYIRGTDAASVPGNDIWHEVGSGTTGLGTTWQNGWTSRTGDDVVKFRKFPDGSVEFRGRCQGGTNDATVFTLPLDYRPPVNIVGITIQNSVNITIGQVSILSTGAVVIESPSALGWMTLFGVRFSTLA